MTFLRTGVDGTGGNDGEGVLDCFAPLARRLMEMSEGVRGSAEKRFQLDRADFAGLLAVVGLGGGPPSLSITDVLADTLRFTQLVSLRTSSAGCFSSGE